MPTQLQMYNRALLNLGETKLAAVDEAREARYVLDEYWDDTRKWMIEAGFWKFALRSVQIDADALTTPAFGYARVFNMPSDWVKTYQVSASESFEPPLDDWIEENNVFLADVTPIFLRYVSNDADGYGYDPDRWTARFVEAFSWKLARNVAKAVSGASENTLLALDKKADGLVSQALSFEALREPPKRPPAGRWNTGRLGGRTGRADGWRYA